jgi:nucleotide-binding universal stress UspA family protein
MAAVVVGASRSSTGRSAVAWAADEAALRRLRLIVVHAWSAPVRLSVEIGCGVDDLFPVGATCRSVPGDPVAALLAQASDLLVVGGHRGASHPSRMLTACLRASRRPLVAVPEGECPPLGRIVVAMSGSRASQAALEWGRREAALRSVPLTAVHAWQRSPGSHAAGETAHARLQAWADTADAAGVRQVPCDLLARHGPPLDTLMAAVGPTDLLVVGRPPPPHAVGRLLHGDVGADLAGLLPCPVVLVPASAR